MTTIRGAIRSLCGALVGALFIVAAGCVPNNHMIGEMPDLATAAAPDLAVQCPEGQVSCDGQCVNLGTDRFNCGGCGKVCAKAATCVNAQCVECMQGLTNCNDKCVNLQGNNANCG